MYICIQVLWCPLYVRLLSFLLFAKQQFVYVTNPFFTNFTISQVMTTNFRKFGYQDLMHTAPIVAAPHAELCAYTRTKMVGTVTSTMRHDKERTEYSRKSSFSWVGGSETVLTFYWLLSCCQWKCLVLSTDCSCSVTEKLHRGKTAL